LLKITTADMITLGRKYIGPWEGVLFGKVWWLSNKIPNFNDAVLPTRFIKLAFDISLAISTAKIRRSPTACVESFPVLLPAALPPTAEPKIAAG
jgi:hypothetical protein